MFDRRDFIKLCAVLGIAGPVAACSDDGEGSSPSTTGDDVAPTPGTTAESSATTTESSLSNADDDVGRVLIVGAGAAGLSAGHMLAQQGIEFEILEAAPTYGGRIKRETDFVDFPIPLGGEWLHEEASELEAIVNDPDVEVTTQLAEYRPDDTVGYYDGELITGPAGDVEDIKFVGATWLDFFDEYVVPSVEGRMRFDTEIVAIDYGGDGVALTDAAGATYEADRVIVTVPLRVLQDGRIEFTPPLPDDKLAALDEAFAWGGMKVFVEFTEAFYPTLLSFPDSETEFGQRIYYDAAYGQESESNVLGLFAVGTGAEPYQALSGDALRDYVLAELDEVFDGAASRTYVQHVAQNWREEPFIGQAYLYDGSDESIPPALWEPVGDRLFFAGDAYTVHGDWSAVDDAAQSARDTVDRMLESS